MRPFGIILTWPHSHGYIVSMKTINAGKFKDQCLRIMDDVARTKTPVVVTKHKRPLVKVMPYSAGARAESSLEGSIVSERGDAFRTGEKWDADLP